MDVNKMSESEKSKALARAMRWAHGNLGLMHDPDGWAIWGIEDGSNCTYGRGNYPSLYHPHNMALAWRVLNWATAPLNPICNAAHRRYLWHDLPRMAPQDAQADWLDTILELVIEFGLLPPETAAE